MSPAVKFLIGLAGVAGMAWVYHGPLGNGERLVDGLEQRARTAVSATNLPGIEVRLGRDPLSRLATLSGQADTFQREGQGELKGINDLVDEVEGVSGVRWADEPEETAIPLFGEVLLQVLLAYLIGLGAGRLLFGRRKRTSFLD